MLLPDVNVLVYAYRSDAPRHMEYAEWLHSVTVAPQAFGLSPLVLSGVVRILTHPKVFATPDTPENALAYVNSLLSRPNAVVIRPGRRHWRIFCDLCDAVGAKGNLVPDAYLGALAIESGCEWITADRDYARFPGLTWRHPLV